MQMDEMKERGLRKPGTLGDVMWKTSARKTIPPRVHDPNPVRYSIDKDINIILG